jgi:hypothetical protein
LRLEVLVVLVVVVQVKELAQAGQELLVKVLQAAQVMV